MPRVPKIKHYDLFVKYCEDSRFAEFLHRYTFSQPLYTRFGKMWRFFYFERQNRTEDLCSLLDWCKERSFSLHYSFTPDFLTHVSPLILEK